MMMIKTYLLKLQKVFRDPNVLRKHIERKLRYWQHYDWEELRMSNKNLKEFENITFDAPTVVIVEPNAYHAETLPGYSKYFQDLGYQVIILLRRTNLQSLVFDRYPKENLPQLYVMTPATMKVALKSAHISNTELTFISSNQFGEKDGYWGFFLDYLRYTPNSKSRYLAIDHNVKELIELKGEGKHLENIFALTPYTVNSKSIPMLNPHYFGDVSLTAKNEEVIFITVGAINGRNRNFSQLIDAANSMITLGYVNFKIYAVGSVDDTNVVKGFPSQFKFFGAVDFPKLFSLMEEADFLLPLLDPALEGNRRYLKGTTSGSRQLILGFSKIPIIHKEFAEVYGFTEDNSVVQKGQNLAEYMIEAIGMSQKTYANKQKSLLSLSKQIQSESVANLKSALTANIKLINNLGGTY